MVWIRQGGDPLQRARLRAEKKGRRMKGWFFWVNFSHPKKGGLGGGFKDFLFSSLFGEMIQFAEYFSDGLKPPTRGSWRKQMWNRLKFIQNETHQTRQRETLLFSKLDEIRINDLGSVISSDISNLSKFRCSSSHYLLNLVIVLYSMKLFRVCFWDLDVHNSICTHMVSRDISGYMVVYEDSCWYMVIPRVIPWVGSYPNPFLQAEERKKREQLQVRLTTFRG